MSALPPPGWEGDLRRALRVAEPEQVVDHVLRFEFDLGTLADHVWRQLDAPVDADDGPNTLNAHGRSLEHGPLAGLGGVIVQELLEPLRARHYAELLPRPFDADYTYVIEYGDEGDWDLPLHVDASHLTLNLCLGDTFEGGDLVLEGLRCEGHREFDPRADEIVALEHGAGRAFVHLGAHRHHVTPVESGRRRNLIVWARHDADEDTLGGNGPCQPWCGLHRERPRG